MRVFLLLSVLLAVGCGPAHRYRPADTLPRGMVEVGGGVGAGVRMDDGSFGGGELQAWLRGGADNRVEVGGRFFTHMLSTFGGAFELRVAAIKGPFDLSIDLGVLGGACCGAGKSNRTLGAAVGLDAGLSIGKRFGSGRHHPAIYFAPHFQLSWVLPMEKEWPKQLYLPLGFDIPLGRSPLRLRPEVLGIGLFYGSGDMEWRVSGGLAIAIQGPGFKLAHKLQRQRRARKAAGLDPKGADVLLDPLQGKDRDDKPPKE